MRIDQTRMIPLEQSHLVPHELQTPFSLKISLGDLHPKTPPSLPSVFPLKTLHEKPVCCLPSPSVILQLALIFFLILSSSASRYLLPCSSINQHVFFNHCHGRPCLFATRPMLFISPQKEVPPSLKKKWKKKSFSGGPKPSEKNIVLSRGLQRLLIFKNNLKLKS